MAKLSARGRTELNRLALDQDLEAKDEFDATHRQNIVAIMSDGTYLKKMVLRYASGPTRSTTWTVGGKYAPRTAEAFSDMLKAKGYVATK